MSFLDIFRKKKKGSPSDLLLSPDTPQKEKKTVETPKVSKAEYPPYLNAKLTWNSYHQTIMSQVRMWQVIALCSFLTMFAAIGGIIHIGLQSKFIPYVVEVDKLGQAMAVAPADRTKPLDERFMHSQLATFIHDSRLVSPDVILQKNAIYRVYSMLDPKDPATMKINQWYNGEEGVTPFKRAEKFTVSAAISSVIPQSPETWQVDWVETVYERSGKLVNETRMRALLTVYVVEPTRETTVEQIRRNPCGLFIKDLNWSKQI